METVRNITLITLLGAALVSASTLANAGDEPTREFSSPYTSLRLMNAGKQSDVWQSGVYITMQKGWKTYSGRSRFSMARGLVLMPCFSAKGRNGPASRRKQWN